jgi:DNA polymerase-4
LRALLGQVLGAKVSALAANDDERRVQPTSRASSVGAQSALGRRGATPDVIRPVLGHLADRVAGRLRAKRRAGRTVTVRVRFANMRAVTRSRTLPFAIATTLTLTEVAEALVHTALADHATERHISLLAISVSNLVDQPVLQLELPLKPAPPDDAVRPGSRVGATRWAVDQSVDAVRRRFGHAAVGYASIVLSEHGSVPDAFRELAEHEL